MKLQGAAAAIALALSASAAWATPSVWADARDPDAAARRLLVSAAESLELKHDHALSDPRRPGQGWGEVRDLAERYLRPAATLLEQAGAARSRDPFLRVQLAGLYGQLGRHPEAAALLEGVVAAEAPPPLCAKAWSMLAETYAHLGRVEQEIAAYTKALEIQPLVGSRATLLSNRAEAMMRLGDVERAVAGYRQALGLLFSGSSLYGSGVTTLWGLGVALDRSGDLDGGIEAVRLARSYDPQDLLINGPGWFYSPDYDRHWYEALGHWAVARNAEVLTSVRVAAYARAEASLREFVSRAPSTDAWLALGRVRLKQCEKERAEFQRKEEARRRAPVPDVKARSAPKPPARRR